MDLNIDEKALNLFKSSYEYASQNVMVKTISFLTNDLKIYRRKIKHEKTHKIFMYSISFIRYDKT